MALKLWKLLDLSEAHNCNIIICRDLNSITLTGRLNTHNNIDIQDVTSSLFDNTRASQDRVISAFVGRK